MHRLRDEAFEEVVPVVSEDDSAKYQPEPFILTRLRDACCDPWPAFQPGFRRMVCSTLDALGDTAVKRSPDHGMTTEVARTLMNWRKDSATGQNS